MYVWRVPCLRMSMRERECTQQIEPALQDEQLLVAPVICNRGRCTQTFAMLVIQCSLYNTHIEA
jgi:hypothetical protein